jgi:hypothetical protein
MLTRTGLNGSPLKAAQEGTPVSRSAARSLGRQQPFPWFYVLGGLGFMAALALVAGLDRIGGGGGGRDDSGVGSEQRPVASKLTLTQIPFDGERAYAYLKEICAIGPRVSGTEGMQRQQAYLQAHFTKLGGRVSLQEFTRRHPVDGHSVRLANMLVEWHPERTERILLCAHYDTRPFPDQDPRDPRGVFLGANDGASGTALLMELGQLVSGLKGKHGVDFVLFDGEELVYDGNRDPYFLGSDHFAREYATVKPPYSYKYAVLLDMVGDKELQIYREVNSMRTPAQKQLVNEIWGVARELGVREFIATTKHELRDDHLALNEIAGIPAIDIIDFDYPRPRVNYWHTVDDKPENCSALSLAKVGWVMKTWLERMK